MPCFPNMHRSHGDPPQSIQFVCFICFICFIFLFFKSQSYACHGHGPLWLWQSCLDNLVLQAAKSTPLSWTRWTTGWIPLVLQRSILKCSSLISRLSCICCVHARAAVDLPPLPTAVPTALPAATFTRPYALYKRAAKQTKHTKQTPKTGTTCGCLRRAAWGRPASSSIESKCCEGLRSHFEEHPPIFCPHSSVILCRFGRQPPTEVRKERLRQERFVPHYKTAKLWLLVRMVDARLGHFTQTILQSPLELSLGAGGP